MTTALELEEETMAVRRKMRPLKSIKLHMADSMVLHRVNWPHEMVYMAASQHMMYDKFSIDLFVSGYMAVMEVEKQSIKPLMAHHLQDLMADAELYSWVECFKQLAMK